MMKISKYYLLCQVKSFIISFIPISWYEFFLILFPRIYSQMIFLIIIYIKSTKSCPTNQGPYFCRPHCIKLSIPCKRFHKFIPYGQFSCTVNMKSFGTNWNLQFQSLPRLPLGRGPTNSGLHKVIVTLRVAGSKYTSLSSCFNRLSNTIP